MVFRYNDKVHTLYIYTIDDHVNLANRQGSTPACVLTSATRTSRRRVQVPPPFRALRADDYALADWSRHCTERSLPAPTKSACACLLLRALSLFRSRLSCAHVEAPLEPVRARPRPWAGLVWERRRSTMYPRLRAPFFQCPPVRSWPPILTIMLDKNGQQPRSLHLVFVCSTHYSPPK
jgi:hypothetical protein